MQLQLFDKGRGLGGRLATRRVEGWQWDHGAQYFTAKTSEFSAVLQEHPVWAAGEGAAWHVGVPGQNAVVKALVGAMPVELGRRIAALTRDADGWCLTDEAGDESGGWDAVVVALPAPQALELLPDAASFKAIEAVRIDPCWALMLATADELHMPDAMTEPRDEVAWLAANHTKPGRAGQGQYVLHASAAWSRAHLEETPDAACERLLALFRELVDESVEVAYATAHRWRYALTAAPLGEGSIHAPDLALGVCGDWCLGARAEHAYLSGRHLAARMLALLPR